MKKKRRRQLTNKRKRFLMINVFLALFLFIGIGYSALSTNLNIFGDVTLSSRPYLYNVFVKEYRNGGAISIYDGEHNDNLDGNGSADIYYWDGEKSSPDPINEKNNVVFADQCWKMYRTTDTGGVKLLYNGVYDSTNGCSNNKPHPVYTWDQVETCDRTDTFPNCRTVPPYYTIESSDTYTYNGDYFELQNPEMVSDLAQRYVCMEKVQNRCTKIGFFVSQADSYYQLVPIVMGNGPTIGDAVWMDIPMNENVLAGVNYRHPLKETIFDDMTAVNQYAPQKINPNLSFYFSNSYVYEGGRYVLIGARNGNYSYDLHYACQGSSTCEELYYIFGQTSSPFYGMSETLAIVLKNGESIDDVINKLLSNEGELYGSVAETVINGWYHNYLLNYQSYIEDTVYCNNRMIIDYKGFNPNSNVMGGIKFYSKTGNSLLCQQTKDSFTLGNTHARLTYPVGLITKSEVALFGHNNSMMYGIGQEWWTMSPEGVNDESGVSVMKTVGSSGQFDSDDENDTQYTGEPLAIRPVISLRPRVEYESGDGSMQFPYTIKISN